MSKNDKKNAAAQEQTAEKVMTKYDRKMQRRKEEKEKEERAQKIMTVVGVLIILALIAVILSFPIRKYIALNKTFIKVGNDEVTQVEFDYCYHTVVNNYVTTYSQYLSWFGLDTSKDLASQQYSENRTWKDYFEEMTISSMRRNKALKADAEAKEFKADVSGQYERILNQQKENAKEAGVSLNKYLQQSFGSYASESRIKPFVEEALYVNEYYKKLSADMTPAEAAVKAKYDEDPKLYDSVDYKIKQFDAELPTEPTDLADPVDETEETDADATYKPSEAEVEKAMADAKELADEAVSSIKTEGEEVTGILYDSANDAIRDWLFDDARKAGDVEVIEDADSDCYYTIAFTKRYRDETPTANVRMMVADTEDEANSILEAWKNTGATEERFEELCNGEFIEKSVADGGLLEGIAKSDDLYEELLNWIFTEGRKTGDYDIVTIPDVASFVIYYVGEGQPKWYKTIESSLLETALSEYVDMLEESCQVSDPDGNLNYLVLEAQEKAAAESAAAESSADESTADEESSPEE